MKCPAFSETNLSSYVSEISPETNEVHTRWLPSGRKQCVGFVTVFLPERDSHFLLHAPRDCSDRGLFVIGRVFHVIRRAEYSVTADDASVVSHNVPNLPVLGLLHCGLRDL